MTQPVTRTRQCFGRRTNSASPWWQGRAHLDHRCTITIPFGPGNPHETSPHVCACGELWPGSAHRCLRCGQSRILDDLTLWTVPRCGRWWAPTAYACLECHESPQRTDLTSPQGTVTQSDGGPLDDGQTIKADGPAAGLLSLRGVDAVPGGDCGEASAQVRADVTGGWHGVVPGGGECGCGLCGVLREAGLRVTQRDVDLVAEFGGSLSPVEVTEVLLLELLSSLEAGPVGRARVLHSVRSVLTAFRSLTGRDEVLP